MFLSAPHPLPFSPFHAANLQQEGFEAAKVGKRQEICLFFFFKPECVMLVKIIYSRGCHYGIEIRLKKTCFLLFIWETMS